MTESFTLSKVVPDDVWAEHKEMVEGYHQREIAAALMPWLAEHGTAIVSRIERREVHESMFPGMLTLYYRLTVTPIGPMDGEFYFMGGPANGKRLPTDGGAVWRVIVREPDVSLLDDTRPHDSGILTATYVKRDDYYVFEGYNR